MRRGAYQVKNDALLGLRRRFPAQVSVREYAALPLSMLVEYTSPRGRRGTLHAPAPLFNSIN
jgi:hypothetical protein